jgi:hypothetical protein
MLSNHLIFQAHAQHALNDLKCMLTIRLKYQNTNIRHKHKKLILFSSFYFHLTILAWIV